MVKDKFIEETKVENKELFEQQYKFSLEIEERINSFYIKVATIAATIGAFSFLILNEVENRNFLILGDLVLLFIILISLWIYIFRTKNLSDSMHNTYARLMTRNWNLISAAITSDDEFNRVLKEEVSKVNKDKVDKIPEARGFNEELLYLVLVSAALILIGLSFIPDIIPM